MNRFGRELLHALSFGFLLLSAVDASGQSLAEAARAAKRAAQSQPSVRTYTDDDLAKLAGSDSKPMVQWTSGTQSPTPPAATAGPLPADESHWRQRTQKLVIARDAASRVVEQFRTQLNLSWSLYHAADDPGYKAQLKTGIDEMEKKLAESEKKLEQVKQELEGLSDEARRAGALPGWTRHD